MMVVVGSSGDMGVVAGRGRDPSAIEPDAAAIGCLGDAIGFAIVRPVAILDRRRGGGRAFFRSLRQNP